jgi:hypothetical protein
MGQGVEVLPFRITAMQNERFEYLSRANPGERIILTTDPPLAQGRVNDILRRTKQEI